MDHQDIVDDLRAEIRSGRRPAGSRLPAIPELAEGYGVSATTVRKALDQLRAESLVASHGSAGTLVQERPPVRRLTAERYRTAQRTVPAPEVGPDWARYGLDARYEHLPADDELAQFLGCPAGTQLLARHFVSYDDSMPTQLVHSYLRWGDVEGTSLSDPSREPWPGGLRAQLTEIGLPPARVVESQVSDLPTRHEAELLRIGPATPVLRVARRHLADDGRALEAARIVHRGDSAVIESVFELE
ncbi:MULTISPECIES: GntR family transcriptional regulator [Streptomyces]|uniref:GntR family transcriptional regulator n=1 Tax=Streptomyces TaxID=1883 RepID=UPI00068B4258|nr:MULTISPECIES: GntR family transcriptional regulator [Streptomyces]